MLGWVLVLRSEKSQINRLLGGLLLVGDLGPPLLIRPWYGYETIRGRTICGPDIGRLTEMVTQNLTQNWESARIRNIGDNFKTLRGRVVHPIIRHLHITNKINRKGITALDCLRPKVKVANAKCLWGSGGLMPLNISLNLM